MEWQWNTMWNFRYLCLYETEAGGNPLVRGMGVREKIYFIIGSVY